MSLIRILQFGIILSFCFSCNEEEILNSEILSETDIINITEKTLLSSQSTQESLISNQGEADDLLVYNIHRDINTSDIDKIVSYYKKNSFLGVTKNYLPVKNLFPTKKVEEYTFEKDGISYEIKIMYLNPETSDLEKKPIITMGMQVELNSEGVRYDDHAAAFFYDAHNQKEEVFFSEETSEKIDNPIFVIINDTDEFIPYDDQLVKLAKVDSENMHISEFNQSANPRLAIDFFAIAFRYENDRYSEYNISFVHYYSNGTFRVGNDHKGTKLKSIHKKDINKTHFDCDEDFFFRPGSYNPGLSLYKGTYICTFECDWLQGVKQVQVSGPGGTIAHGVRMNYSNDFYQRIYHPWIKNYVELSPVSYEKGMFSASIRSL